MTEKEGYKAPELMALGELITSIYKLKQRRKDLAEADRDLKMEQDTLEANLLIRLTDAEIVTARSGNTNVTISEIVVPAVDDFDETLNWIGEDFENRKHLLHRRVASGPYKETINMGESVPGISPFTKRGINLKKL